MAKINNKKQFSGMIGNLVFRTLEGQQIVQSAPRKFKQSKLTQMSGSEFRQCSKWGRHLRIILHDFLEHQTDSYMHRRLTTALYDTILGNTHLPKGERSPMNCEMQSMSGFDFNIHSPWSDYFQLEVTTSIQDDGRVLITIPAFKPADKIQFPKKIYNAELMVYVFSVHQLLQYKAENASIFVMPFQKNSQQTEPQSFLSEHSMPAGDWVLAVAKLHFYTQNAFVGKKYENNAQMSPTQIIFSGRG